MLRVQEDLVRRVLDSVGRRHVDLVHAREHLNVVIFAEAVVEHVADRVALGDARERLLYIYIY
jgi:hypothetical protein